MCRLCSQGGRRCPGDSPEKRRARQNAAYHAKTHTGSPRQPDSGNDDATASAGLPPLGDSVTPEIVRDHIEHARTVLERADDRPSPHIEGATQRGERLTVSDSKGWQVPTEYGLEAEAATRAAGAAIAARGEELAADALAAANPSQDKAVLDYVPEGAATRQEYADAVQKRADSLNKKVDALRKQANAEVDREERSRLIQEHNSRLPETNRYIEEAARVQQADSAWDRIEAKAYSDGYRAALAEQRGFGLPGGKMIEVDSKSQKATVERLKKGLHYYPSDWLSRDGSYEAHWETNGIMGPQAYQQRIPLRVKSTSKRAHYADVVGERRLNGGQYETSIYSELTIGKRDDGCLGPGVTTAVHEYGHRAERIQPRVNDLAQTHLARRTMGSDRERHQLEPYLVGKQRARSGPSQDMFEYERRDEGKSEWVRPDDFAVNYTGKQNSAQDDSSEVFTTGMEGVFAGRFGGLRGAGRWKEDREHRDFILGTLATVK